MGSKGKSVMWFLILLGLFIIAINFISSSLEGQVSILAIKYIETVPEGDCLPSYPCYISSTECCLEYPSNCAYIVGVKLGLNFYL